MKQRLTLVVTLAAVFGVGLPASAQTVAETAAAARVASASAREAATTVSTAQIAETVAAARIAAAGAREVATTISTAQIAETVAAARVAAADAREGATTVASLASFTYAAGQFDRDQDREQDRAQREAQREKEEAAREKDRVQREKEREYSAYDQGQQALDSGRWDRAISSFDRVIELKGTKSDAALYWKAYAQNKLGQRPEALATIGVLLKDHPKSRYLSDARALEVEVKQSAGQPVNPAAESDEEIEDHGAQLAPAQRAGRGHPDAGEGPAWHRFAAAEGAGAVRARSEQLAESARRPRQHREGERQSGPPAARRALPGDSRRAREPRGAGRHLRHHLPTST